MARFYTPSYDSRTVAAMNVDIEAIRETVAAFHSGNPHLLLVATALRRAFEEGAVGGGTPVVRGRARESAEEIRAETTTVEMIDPEQASPRVQQIFDDIKLCNGAAHPISTASAVVAPTMAPAPGAPSSSP